MIAGNEWTLAPVPRDPDVAVAAAVPASLDPDLVGMRRDNPAARRPHVPVPIPKPLRDTYLPDVPDIVEAVKKVVGWRS